MYQALLFQEGKEQLSWTRERLENPDFFMLKS